MIDIVCFLSRPHGFAVLEKLIKIKKFNILKLYTHSLNPKSQDPNRSIRTDFKLFQQICEQNNIDLESIDSKESEITSFPNCDYIIEVSWRYLIPTKILSLARKDAFGIHRGKLPDYAGAEPIKQALLKNDNKIILSAHYLANKIDMGNVIDTVEHDVNYDKSKSFEENIQRLRDEITPFFPQLAISAINVLEEKNSD
ncbi:formyltransferase family protein [Nitrosopumilus maritimus]|uniref:Methionyl-tRNA formyltransferase-like protein n=1 Tax=Nitrosopumilus maritimus (strain SCM1) TaxID=436308 RepID=A9A1R3_NITMS|nr:formyltransferase family protein [Nitrosopumilus maritimus]ABX12034.1 Methionyl-tRNA formyltransferase-like protein [Nitrosopumilus maritimus SCM1]